MARSQAWTWPIRLGLLNLSLALLGLAPSAHSEAFGRWESKLQDCVLLQGLVGLPLEAQRQSCVRLRLEQNLEGLLTVRLITTSGGQRFGSQNLVFGGALAPGQRPMRCSTDGHCKPRWPMRLEVATVASNLAREESLAPTIPLARLAKGSCLLERRSLQCQARDQDGQLWEAKARF
jgi:hypothetical protein